MVPASSPLSMKAIQLMQPLMDSRLTMQALACSRERLNSFFAFYTMSYAATLAVAFSANLFTLYVFY